jgi:hypothetical protein
MDIHLQRIHRMHYKLLSSPNGVSREDLIIHVFEGKREDDEGMTDKKKREFIEDKRTEFFKVLKALRAGDFELNKKNKRSGKKATKPKYNIPFNNGKYRYIQSQVPVIEGIEEDDRLLLPFILGILDAYNGMSIACSTYDYLKNKFCVSDLELETSIALASGLRDLNNEDVVENVVFIQKNAIDNKKLKFHYSPVRLNEPSFDIEVFPLQILLYDGLYYLWATRKLDKSKIEGFRIDRISGIEALEAPGFDCLKLRKSLSIAKILEHTIGAVAPEPGSKPKTFKIKFYDWAAAHVESAKLHHTMKIEKSSMDKDYRVVTIEVYDTYEVSFLLGRYRDYCEVLEPKNYEYDLRKNKETTKN